MKNTKRFHYKIYLKVTPYFNEDEFINWLIELGSKETLLGIHYIRWKGRQYNMILSKEIDKLIDIVKICIQIPYLKIELDIYKANKLEKIHHFKEIIPIKLWDPIPNKNKK